MKGTSIPILTYHRIADGEKLDIQIFESHLKALAASGVPSLLPENLENTGNGFLLTFDDGYTDCWTHVFPLLKRYGLHAVIFVIPSTAGDGPPRAPGKRVYPHGASQALGEASMASGPHEAFLRWSEMAEMEASGLVAIQSHSLEHRSIWGGDQLTGFNLGAAGRTHWSLSQITDGDVRLGIPVYQRGSALAFRRYYDNRKLRDLLADWLDEKGGADYVAERGSRAVASELLDAYQTVIQNHDIKGTWESMDDRRQRTTADIAGARHALEKRLGGVRDELCLPWGEYDTLTLDCAKQAGICRVYTLDRGPNPARQTGFLLNRFEPRPRGPFWLKTRMWIYASTFRTLMYSRMSPRGSRSKKKRGPYE